MRTAVVFVMSLAGCAEISGLGGLEITDATTPIDAPSGDVVTTADASDAADAIGDAASNASDATDATGSPETSLPCKTAAECKGSVCCETFSGGAGQIPSCSYDADTVVCTSADKCPTTIGFNCSAPDLFRRCASNADCTESNYNKCCTGKIGDSGTRTVCLSSQVAQLINATCM